MAEGSYTDDPENLLKSSPSTMRDGNSIREDGEHHNLADKYEVIQTDVSTSSRDRDAPGQNCTYIPPGDHRIEFYRLGTYAKFPKSVPVKPTDMAAAGFYWTGFNDRVRCFSCGMTAENWALGDDGMDYQWHKSNCKMVAGHEIFNIPIPEPNFRSLFRLYRADPNSDIMLKISGNSGMDISDEMNKIQINEPLRINFANIVDPEHETMLRSANLRNELERRKTFAKWPSYPAPYLISDLAKEGFFYLGNLDRAQCFSCSGVLRNWAPSDSVSEQHRRHFGHCKICRGEPSGNNPMPATERTEMDRQHRAKMERLTSNQGEPADPSPEEQRDLAERFPCREPVNPHMVSLATRIATFNNLWPSQRIRAPVEQIAKAGFFYLGESDKTKCFYCNGGLQNWDINDEPWTEHAKWFPGICRGEPSGNDPMPVTERTELDRRHRAKRQRLTADHAEPPGSTPEDQQRNIAKRFSCREPVHPHRVSSETQISTCNNPWPRQRTQAPVEQIAKADFFFLGNSDKTKSFYCNGGHQNRDINEEPWTEQAKWFPGAPTSGNDIVQDQVASRNEDELSQASRNRFPQQVPSNHDIKYGRRKSQGKSVGEPMRQAKTGTTESDALPIVDQNTLEAETELEPDCSYVFIPDTASERDRLASFLQCPGQFVPSMRLAAQHGLYYTGRGDVARCFGCNAIWGISQGAYTTNLHQNDCQSRNSHLALHNVPMNGFGQFQEALQQSRTINQPVGISRRVIRPASSPLSIQMATQ